MRIIVAKGVGAPSDVLTVTCAASPSWPCACPCARDGSSGSSTSADTPKRSRSVWICPIDSDRRPLKKSDTRVRPPRSGARPACVIPFCSSRKSTTDCSVLRSHTHVEPSPACMAQPRLTCSRMLRRAVFAEKQHHKQHSSQRCKNATVISDDGVSLYNRDGGI